MHTEKKYVAALDLGSNSFHLAIGELDDYGVLHTIERRKENVRLAAGLDDKNTLSQEAIAKALRSIERFAQQIDYVHPQKRRVVATSTLRKAKNAFEFCTPAEQILECEIDVISGIEEARLILFGVNQSIEPIDLPRVVIDIGGGSTEIAVSQGDSTKFLDSFDIGCVSLTKRYFADKSYGQREVDAAFYDAKLIFEGLHESLPTSARYQLIGTSGTLKALGRIATALELAPAGTLNQNVLSQLEQRWLEKGGLCEESTAVISQRRLGVLPGGLAVIRAALKAAKIDDMVICDSALRDGVLHELANTPHPAGVRDRTIERLQISSGVNRQYADRVARTAMSILTACNCPLLSRMSKLLDTAIKLHEIGVLISHNEYAEHGAYILKNGDLLGYDLLDQRIIGELVRQQRGKVDAIAAEREGINRHIFVVLLAILRISIALHLGRKAENVFPKSVKYDERNLTISMDPIWLNDRPLTRVAISAINNEFSGSGIELLVE